MNVQISSWPVASSAPAQGNRRRSYQKRGRPESGRFVADLVNFADQQDAEILARHLLRAQEAERSRIAVELHDGINQEIAMLSMELGTAISRVAEAPLRERLVAIRNRAMRISEEVRRISHGLRPALIEYVGFAGAVRCHCRDISENSGLRLDLEADDSLSLPTEAATALYRIVQEALQNVVRHAGATAARVQIQERDGFLVLSVEDNGVGFSREALPSGSGMGLASMRERARSLGGELTVMRSAPHGTRVEVVIPLSRRVS